MLPRSWRTVLLLLLLSVVGPLQAEALTPMRAQALPSLKTDSPLIGLARVQGRAIAITHDGAWSLQEGARAWSPLPWPEQTKASEVVSLVQDGERAYLLLGQGAPRMATQVVQLSLRDGAIALQPLAPLPLALRDARGALSADAFYIAGTAGDGSAHLLQLSFEDERPHWAPLPPWPGGGAASSLVAQTKALFAVVPSTSGGDRVLRWSAEPGWTEPSRAPGRVVPGSGRAIGQAHILYLVEEGAEAGAAAKVATYQTITASWATLPGAQAGRSIATAAWPDGLIWAQAGADGREIAFASAQVQSSKLRLHWLDWVVIVVYLAGMIGIGLYFYLREKRSSTSNFFVGGRTIPFWAAGISLYAANTSSISFIAIPAKAFETNWQYMANNVIAVFGLMFVAVWIVPLLRRLDLMSVFSYLETRFHPSIRMLASALCVFVQIGSRMSVILFLPALAIATITGISVFWSVILMGGFTIVYTAMGGMKAVIWTDFVQVIVKMGGAIFAIGFMIWSLRGGFGEFWSAAMAENKMHTFDFSFDLTKATVWGFIFLVLFEVVLTFPKDQVLMQRTLSTKSDREAGRSIWAFAAIMIPGGIIFYTIGTALFVYYKANPERMNPLLPIDATFPMFIAAELPVGVTGLIIAGIFAAAMATLSGIMNSVATLISVDFYEKLAKNRTPKQSVFFAEIMTVVVGLVGIATALVLSRFDIHSLFDVSIELAGLLGGGFAGAYTLGMFTRRANSPGVAIGIGASIVLTLVIWSFDMVHPYFYLAISILLCIVIGYVASLFFPAPTRSLKGLTIYRDRVSDV
ncbi:sodium:solute symporter [Lysobacter sp. cf310]|uniref:sodium:solute symporter n=1 Tax=Lysobacter sp. cf310 TaxID=1761790 RepID=UPI0020C8DA38|nr:sodium:solute symporter [Lysobacter sp. cf310]